MGQLSTYGKIAEQIGKANASRAVGTAIGSNPVAFIIPCHRVIQSTGNIGGYMWGKTQNRNHWLGKCKKRYFGNVASFGFYSTENTVIFALEFKTKTIQRFKNKLYTDEN